MTTKRWLLKAEPDSRIVKGKDVKFSVDDFESVQVSPWEGVRNYEARNLMKEMSVGDQALFYHSNCKNPGVAAFAEVAKTAYPDYTAWDSSHPYYDAKTDKDAPKWFMVDLKFTSRTANFVSLALLKWITSMSDPLPESVAYIGKEGLDALKTMDLVARGRLSVQRVTEEAWNAITLLAEKGGWTEDDLKPPPKSKKARAKPRTPAKSRAKRMRKVDSDDEGEESEEVMPTPKKRRAPSPPTGVEGSGRSRSTRDS
ncbi:PUA-like domain-containing protein [Mucidula mucida]|nr:PUA-like domain-containing protein [Mucidula mucida]